MGEALNDAEVKAAAAMAAVGITDREQFNAAMQQLGISAALESRRGDLYNAFVEAYEPDPKNDRHAQFLREAEAGEATATAALGGRDETPVVLKLDAKATAAYAAATTLREREHALVQIGGKQLRERGVLILERLAAVGSLDHIAPQDEALLRLLGAIESTEDGLVLRERALLEAADYGAGYDDGYGGAPPAEGGQLGYTGSSPFDNAYLPYGQGPFGQQQYLADQWDMLAKAFHLSTHHPVARQALYVLTNFPLGRGVAIRSKNKEQQAVIDEFLEANSLNDRLVTWWTDWIRDGETFLYAPTSSSSDESILHVDSIDPNTIWEIVTDAANPADIKYFRQQFQTRMQLFSSGTGGQAYIMRDLKPPDVLHAKLNVAAAEMRGRSQLMPSFGWLKMLSDHFTTMVVSEQAAAATTWDLTVKGNSADVGMVLGAFTLPTAVTPGTVNAHNDAVEVKKLFGAANSTVSSGGSAYQGLLNLAVMGFGLAMEYFGGDGGSTRAATLMASDPPVQLMLMLQTLGRERLIGPLVRKQLRWAQKTGRLAPGPLDYAIDFPALVSADANDRRKALYEGLAMGFVSHKSAAQSFAQEENLRDYDYEAEMTQIVKEQTESLNGVVDKENPAKLVRPPAAYTWSTYAQTERWTTPNLAPSTLDVAALPAGVVPGLAPPNGKLPAGPPAAHVNGNSKHPASVSGRADVPDDTPGA